jgi:transcriptional regulator with XRE-family HTH domain
MRRAHAYSQRTQDQARLLGLEIARARRARRWTSAQLAERAGISRGTLSAVERGASTVALGAVFEVANIVGLDLFGADRGELKNLLGQAEAGLRLLPAAVRAKPVALDTDF